MNGNPQDRRFDAPPFHLLERLQLGFLLWGEELGSTCSENVARELPLSIFVFAGLGRTLHSLPPELLLAARKCCQGRSRNGRLRSTTATADEPLRHSLPSIRSSHDRGAHNQVPRPTQASISCLVTVCVESARHTYTYVITRFPEPFILYAIVSCLVTPCMELPRNTHTYVMPRFPELFIVYRVPA